MTPPNAEIRSFDPARRARSGATRQAPNMTMASAHTDTTADVVDGVIVADIHPAHLSFYTNLSGRRISSCRWEFPIERASEVVAATKRAGGVVSTPLADLASVAQRPVISVSVSEPIIYVRVAGTSDAVEMLKANVPEITWRVGPNVWVAPYGEAQLVGLARYIALSKADVLGDLAQILKTLDPTKMDAVRASRSLESSTHIARFNADLNPAQVAGVDYIRRHRRVIVGDDPGLGKTRTALAAIEQDEAYPAVIVCQAKMRFTVRWEIHNCLPHRTVSTVTTSKDVDVDADIIVISYKLLPLCLDILKAVCPQTLILDESQAFKNGKALQTKAAKALAELVRRVHGRDAYILLLSGTWMVSQPADLISQLEIIDKLGEFGGWKGFTKRYCAATTVQYYRKNPNGGKPILSSRQDISGADNLIELHERLRATCLLRRQKSDVLSELPPIEHMPVIIDPEELNPAAWKRYRLAEADLAAYLTSTMLASDGKVDHETLLRSLAAETLVQRTHLRELAGLAKIDWAANWLTEFLADNPDESVLAFAWHRDVVNGLADKLGAPRILGGMTPVQVDAAKNAFQAKTARLLVASLGVGSRGHTLTAGTHAVFIEEPWSSVEILQAVSRMYGRLVDAHGVTAWHFLADQTIDADMLDIITTKDSLISAVLDGQSTAVEQHDETGRTLRNLMNRLGCGQHPA